MTVHGVDIPEDKIADFCRRHHIRKLALFGSILRDDFGPDSDIDVLVEFDPEHIPGLAFFGMEEELSQILGRKVDLNTKEWLSPYFRQDAEERVERPKAHRFDPEVKSWLFPQLLAITRRWLHECVELKDNTFYQLLLLHERAHDAADRIYHAIVRADAGAKTLKPILRPYDTVGSTRYVDFDTTRPTYKTRADRCHVSHVVADTGSWEQKLAQSLEDMGEVIAYVKNDHLGFAIPYTLNGEERNYIPDFIACVEDGHGPGDLLNLIVEVTGEKKKDKAAKVATARTLWVPAVNNHGGFGRWAFIEIDDPWDAKNAIRASLQKGTAS